MPLPSASSTDRTAYFLVSHGSRDPRPAIAIQQLVTLVSQRLQGLDRVSPALFGSRRSTPVSLPPDAAPLIGTGVLELAPSPLHQQIQAFAHKAHSCGYAHIRVVPLFLLPGVHVMEDIPAEVELAQPGLPTEITLAICPYVGLHSQLKHLLSYAGSSIAPSVTTGKILISHGSRRVAGNQPVETIAAELGAIPAYWSVAPHLETQVSKLVTQGCQHIMILPYFLFEGGITDAIGATVAQLASQFPKVQLQRCSPLGATPQLADLVVDLMQ